MAKVLTESGTNVSGRVGDVVYVRYKGGIYVRKAAKKRSDANAPKMVRNQQRFVMITRFCVQFKHTLIRQIWNDQATRGSGYNLFMKTNTSAFAKDGSLADPLLLKFSVGTLRIPEDLTAQRIAPEASTIRISWVKEASISGTRSKDELMMITSDGEQFSPMTPTGIKRKVLEGQVELPAMPWHASYIYLFFMSDDRRGFSGSRGFSI